MAPMAEGTVVPQFLSLDASIMDGSDDLELIRDYIKENRIEFCIYSPDGGNDPLKGVSLFEQCRALCDTDNFDNMYDFTMRVLQGKRLVIYIRDDDGSRRKIGDAVVQDKMDDMALVYPVFSEYPILMNWLVEWMGAYISKKFPLPTSGTGSKAAEKEEKKPRKKKWLKPDKARQST